MNAPETRLTLLGTQGWIPTALRQTTSLALQYGQALLLFDAGTGLSRLLKPPLAAAVRDAGELHLFLTHYHLDHTCGLAYLTGITGGRRLTVHVPASSVNGVEPAAGVPALIRPPFHPVSWEDHADYRLDVLDEGEHEIAGLRVRLRAQCHADISVAYRVGDLFVLATDTVADPGTAAFAAGAQLLLHEAWIDGAEEDDPSQAQLVRRTYATHSSARQVTALADEAGVAELHLIHLNPLFDEEYYRRMEQSARARFAATCVPADLHVRLFDR
jgi:ribonuclease BN (tRNA processing enzyme)